MTVIALIYVLYLAVILPLVAIGTCAACAAGIPVTYLVVLTRVLVSRPGWLPDPKHLPHPPPAGSDPAVPQYFYGFSWYGLYGPAVADIVHAVRVASDACRTIWGYSVNAALVAMARRQPRIASLLRAVGAMGMGAGIVIGTFVAGCFAFIHLLVVSLCAVAWRCLAAVLNGVHAAARRTQTCPGCTAQVHRPQYRCPGHGCRRRHTDLRPGPFGVMRRHCHCGTSVRIRWLVGPPPATAICPQCDHPLGQASQHILLPFLGATDMARDQQMLGLVEQLRAWDIEGQLSVVADDPGVTMEPSSALDHVSPSRHSHAVRVLADGSARVLCMFDATDDLGHGPERPDGVRTCALLVDPGPDGDSGYDQALGQIEAMGLDSREVRLAVIFTQGDLVDPADRKVVRWARRELGLGDLVGTVRRDFKESRFFCAGAEGRGNSASLLRWLLRADGVAPAMNRVVVDVRKEEEISYRWHRRYIFAATLAVIVTMFALLFTS